MTWNVITNLSKQFAVEGDLSEAIKQMGDNVTTITAVRVGQPAVQSCGTCEAWRLGQCTIDGALTSHDDHCQAHRTGA